MCAVLEGAFVKAGMMDRRIQVLRHGPAVDDGYQMIPGALGILCERKASIRRLKGSEGIDAGGVEAVASVVFHVHSDSKTRLIDPRDKIAFDGRIYEIQSVMEVDRRKGIEIVAVASADGAALTMETLAPVDALDIAALPSLP